MLDFKKWLEGLSEPSPTLPIERRPDVGTWRGPPGFAKWTAKLPPWKKRKKVNIDDKHKGYNQ
jgi:hypothetical protein